MKKVYLQMASFKMCQSELSYEAQLKCAAQMGYSGIELSGLEYSMMTAQELKALTDRYGLEIISAHISADALEERIDYLTQLGVKKAVIASYTFANREEALEFSRILNHWGKIYAEHGITLAYHNHTQEFFVPENETDHLHKMLMEYTDEAYVKFQLDAGWASCAGIDVVDYIKQNSGRFELMHITESDKVFGAEEPMHYERDVNGRIIPTESFKKLQAMKRASNCPLGKGINDWSALITAALNAGIKIFINERRSNYKGDTILSLKEDLEYLHNMVQ